MMVQRRRQPQTQRLRKQPKMRRVQAVSAVPIPRLEMPKTARQRRRRNRMPVHVPLTSIKRIVLSARWVSLGLLALCVYALVLTGLDEHFYLTTIPVEGTLSIPPTEIAQASGLAGAHIFAADPNEAAARIAELPGIVAATVTLRWPSEVSIRIQEDSPIALWQEGNQQYWISEKGSLLPARIETVGLLTIESELSLRSTSDETGEAETGLAFIPKDVLSGALLLRQLRPNIDKLYYRASEGLSYQDGRGWRVYFGTGDDMQQKLVVYETMVEDLLARGVTPTYISVSNQKKPYYGVR